MALIGRALLDDALLIGLAFGAPCDVFHWPITRPCKCHMSREVYAISYRSGTARQAWTFPSRMDLDTIIQSPRGKPRSIKPCHTLSLILGQRKAHIVSPLFARVRTRGVRELVLLQGSRGGAWSNLANAAKLSMPNEPRAQLI
ncbi:hypothetical protein EJ06DRAFT_97938 [Trichodelitschia bisporula]|uniref:Uncharacterized protein n=1 Tax=Trichodelitschia bisporula TaxID=703511 RepID=A0A6G1HQW3_9PEZI|nr:hypothetical protein EJ06DRAFT_97938 [Trichodelitschia bisporula]